MTSTKTGNWRLDIGQVSPLFDKGKLQEAVFSGDDCIALCGESQANARLIAAAPELLRCLVELLEIFDMSDMSSRDLPEHEYSSIAWEAEQQARAAIAKAKGE